MWPRQAWNDDDVTSYRRSQVSRAISGVACILLIVAFIMLSRDGDWLGATITAVALALQLLLLVFLFLCRGPQRSRDTRRKVGTP